MTMKNLDMDLVGAINHEAAGQAAAALSKLSGRPMIVEISDPKQGWDPVRPTRPLAGEEPVTAVRLPVLGNVRGTALLVLEREASLALCDLLLKRAAGATRSLAELETSALQEVGNIIVGNYLTVLANRLRLRVIEHLPELYADTFAAIWGRITRELGERIEEVLTVEVRFGLATTHISGRIMLILVTALEAVPRALRTR